MRRRVRLPHHVVDAALAVALTVPAVAGLVLDDAQPDRPWWIVAPLAAASTLPLAARRSYPLSVLAATVAATFALNATGVSTLGPGVYVAMYTVGAHVERRAASTGAAAVVVLAGMLVWRDGLGGVPVGELLFVAGAWLLGKYLRTRREYLRELEEKAERLEREREEHERRAAAEEQARIARELHDVIAHNVSVMVVQAAGGREVFDRSPERARDALAAIEATGRDALTELRRLLGVAAAGGEGPREPQPGVSQLPALVDQVRTTGLAVDLEIDGDARPLEAGVDLSVYRVVQEALTNTLKHAAARRASVLVRYRARDVVVEVLDDGRTDTAEGAQDGRGLVGMRERVALFGGELDAGARAGGGYRVRARFPLGSSS